MLEIIVPWPSAKLAPNRRLGKHWSATAKAKASAKEDAAYQVMAERVDRQILPPDGNIALRLTFCPPDKRRRDLDNLLASMKHALDGIAIGLGVDDSRFCPITLEWGEVGRPGHVVVRLN